MRNAELNESFLPLRHPHTSAYLFAAAGPSEGILPHADKKETVVQNHLKGKLQLRYYPRRGGAHKRHELLPHNHSGTVSRGLSEARYFAHRDTKAEYLPSKQKIDSADTQDQIAKPSESERAVRSPCKLSRPNPRGRGLGARESISH